MQILTISKQIWRVSVPGMVTRKDTRIGLFSVVTPESWVTNTEAGFFNPQFTVWRLGEQGARITWILLRATCCFSMTNQQDRVRLKSPRPRRQRRCLEDFAAVHRHKSIPVAPPPPKTQFTPTGQSPILTETNPISWEKTLAQSLQTQHFPPNLFSSICPFLSVPVYDDQIFQLCPFVRKPRPNSVQLLYLFNT